MQARAKEMGGYDHHAELDAMRKQMEMEEQARDLEAAHAEGEIRNRETLDGIEQDQQFAREFDDITRQLRNHHPYGQYRVRKGDPTDNDDKGRLAQLGIRESSDNRLTFRRLPCVVWTCGILIIVAALYLFYHLALGHLGVLFKGYREGHWW